MSLPEAALRQRELFDFDFTPQKRVNKPTLIVPHDLFAQFQALSLQDLPPSPISSTADHNMSSMIQRSLLDTTASVAEAKPLADALSGIPIRAPTLGAELVPPIETVNLVSATADAVLLPKSRQDEPCGVPSEEWMQVKAAFESFGNYPEFSTACVHFLSAGANEEERAARLTAVIVLLLPKLLAVKNAEAIEESVHPCRLALSECFKRQHAAETAYGLMRDEHMLWVRNMKPIIGVFDAFRSQSCQDFSDLKDKCSALAAEIAVLKDQAASTPSVFVTVPSVAPAVPIQIGLSPVTQSVHPAQIAALTGAPVRSAVPAGVLVLAPSAVNVRRSHRRAVTVRDVCYCCSVHGHHLTLDCSRAFDSATHHVSSRWNWLHMHTNFVGRHRDHQAINEWLSRNSPRSATRYAAPAWLSAPATGANAIPSAPAVTYLAVATSSARAHVTAVAPSATAPLLVAVAAAPFSSPASTVAVPVSAASIVPPGTIAGPTSIHADSAIVAVVGPTPNSAVLTNQSWQQLLFLASAQPSLIPLFADVLAAHAAGSITRRV